MCIKMIYNLHSSHYFLNQPAIVLFVSGKVSTCCRDLSSKNTFSKTSVTFLKSFCNLNTKIFWQFLYVSRKSNNSYIAYCNFRLFASTRCIMRIISRFILFVSLGYIFLLFLLSSRKRPKNWN